ncbi:threonine-phosphate decarboxylase CobD [Roseibium aestuarii]|uniref:threonine-phosphate decarboxylase n=1 Tax=Roseibium aestuarii TaxID=2600299 RepID=A0ABW4JQS0_9HYPH|nr:threonine-phosphate decarboxylase CobD [Roseibium aestuarii]
MRHGGDLGEAIAQFGGTPDSWLDLSTGINPHPYPVEGILKPDDWTRLPSEAALRSLRQAARKAYSIPRSQALAVTPGTQVIISLLPDALPLGPLHLLGPTYSSHSQNWNQAGREVHEALSWHDLLAAMKRLPGHVLLVNPNNPDGRSFKPQALIALAEHLAQSGHYLIVDEAFADCVPQVSVLPHLENQHNILVLRSFGKFFGLAGVRLGFLVGPDKICGALTLTLDTWAVNGPALAIGARALGDTAWQATTRERLHHDMKRLTLTLEHGGLSLLGHVPLFALFEHPRAHQLHAALARRGIWTRRFDHTPNWLRFGLPPKTADLNRLSTSLIDAFTEI